MKWNDLRNQRLQYAHQCVKAIDDIWQEPEPKKKYRASVRGYGASVHRQNLMQDLIGRLSDAGKDNSKGLAAKKFIEHLLVWLLKDAGNPAVQRTVSEQDMDFVVRLVEFLLNEPDESLLYYTQEALLLAEQIKRFAEAMLPSDKEV
jgi:CRISPR type III-B/RAMP module-associated protein Cmr5